MVLAKDSSYTVPRDFFPIVNKKDQLERNNCFLQNFANACMHGLILPKFLSLFFFNVIFSFSFFRFPRRSLRGEHRRLSRESMPERGDLYRQDKRILVSLSTIVHGDAVRAGRGRVLGSSIVVPQRCHVHQFTR